MRLFEKKARPAAPVVQTRTGERHPFGIMDSYVPLHHGELALYRAIREALPIVDAAVGKLIRLSGGLSVECPKGAEELNEFLRTVDTGRGMRGIQSFLDQYLDSMLVCGRGVGEIVLDSESREIAALLNADPASIEVKEGDSPLDFAVCARRLGGSVEELPRQELILFTPFQPEADSPYGVSLLRSMPFMTEVLLKIYQATGQNWERMGNARYAVVYRPQSGESGWARERGEDIAREWQKAMEAGKAGSIRDFVAVGDVDIKVIGADGQVLDAQTPARLILEQIVSKTGIPPFLLGLSWASTERMSSQQSDMMTTEITAIRRMLTPVVERICETWLRLHGYPAVCRVEWDDINLQDIVEEARAEVYHAQAESIAAKTAGPSA